MWGARTIPKCYIGKLSDLQPRPKKGPEKNALGYTVRRTTELVKGLELELFSLERRRLRGDLVTLYNHLKGGCNQVGVSLFSQATVTGSENTSLKMDQERFRLNIKGKFFMKNVAKHWNRLFRELLESPPLEELKKQLDVALSVTV
ncbi:hypothetical protein WISP_103903 [Willisornis vidua]|uniref:Uncharacterized protein n=1 Tax=Willisornis vidua TaxID=1566151 RepID=A0ABQ9D3H9_9PASS|nr:hypothetical protein WISP_103903 [Willisornis vidua]